MEASLSRKYESSVIAIGKSLIVNAEVERVWRVVSDIDRDPEYWRGLDSVQNIERKGNTVKRKAFVGFIGKSIQMVNLNPKESVELRMISGPLGGRRLIKLNPCRGGRTKISVSWHFRFLGVPEFAQGYVKDQLVSGTEEALEKIKVEVERRTGGERNSGPG
jgi:uncharacterized membrane protein